MHKGQPCINAPMKGTKKKGKKGKKKGY